MLRRAHRCRSKGQRPPTISEYLCADAEYRKPQETSQTISALASRTVLSGRCQNPGSACPDFVTSATSRYWTQPSSWPTRRSWSRAKRVSKDGRRSNQEQHAMTHEARQAVARPILNSIEAQLFVADIKVPAISTPISSASRSPLSMAIRHSTGRSCRDNARLNLRLVCEPVFAGDIRKREHLLSASITVATANEIKATVSELSGCRRALSSATEEGALGRQNLHRPGSR